MHTSQDYPILQFVDKEHDRFTVGCNWINESFLLGPVCLRLIQSIDSVKIKNWPGTNRLTMLGFFCFGEKIYLLFWMNSSNTLVIDYFVNVLREPWYHVVRRISTPRRHECHPQERSKVRQQQANSGAPERHVKRSPSRQTLSFYTYNLKLSIPVPLMAKHTAPTG